MALFDAFDKRLHLAELADPLDTQEGVLTPTVRRARMLANLAGVAAFSAAQLAFLAGVTAGTGLASKALVLDSGGVVTLPTGGRIVQPLVRSTVTNAAVVSSVQMHGGIVYQDASGGSVTMTTRTATEIAADFPEVRVGDSIALMHASNHASNTSTIAGGTGVTLVGSGAVTALGGQYRLIKTAATTFDMVRVG